MALLDNGAQINTIMPKYVRDRSLQMGLITNLLGAKVACVGLGNAYMRPLGYIIIWVQVDRVQGYEEDQIALVILDLSNFVTQIPVILGTPTISWVVNVMKEVEIDTLATPWANARVAHLLSLCRMMDVKVSDGTEEESSSDDYGQVMFTQDVETIEAFSSHMVPVKVGRAYTGKHINIMVQAFMVVRNSTAYPQTLWKKTPVARAVAVHPVPKPPVEAQLQEGVDKPQNPHYSKLTVRQRHGKLLNELDLSGLDSWPLELADATHWLLAKYHDVLLLDPVELGCTHSTKHVIKVTDDTPFKEQFKQIPMPLVEEVWNHLWEMLESGTNRPSQSAWCNVVVLVRKKDGSLWFYIDFHCLNACTKRTPTPCLEYRRLWRVW